MRFLRPPGLALVALVVIALATITGGCTSRWAVRGNVDLTGDASAANLSPQKDPLLADPRTADMVDDSPEVNP